MNLHREVHFEQAICDHLAAHGWLNTEGDAEHYDHTCGLYLCPTCWPGSKRPSRTAGSAWPGRTVRQRANASPNACARTSTSAARWTSADLNPGLKGRDIREAFARPGYHLLLVANKFQTGFDQPLLCGMYVDKMLGGIQAVQTLSRLNRAHPGKDTTYILDFVNEAAEILKAFKTYYDTAELEATTDPHLVFDLRAKLDASGHYDDFEVQRVAKVETDPLGTQAQLSAAIAPVADRLLKRYKTAQQTRAAALAAGDDKTAESNKDVLDALVLFKNDMRAYVRLYAFLSQMFDYGNTDIEKRFIFYKRLIPLLEFGRERDTVDLSKVVADPSHLAQRRTPAAQPQR